ncbi:hypothetical protein GDO86_008447 [Hymenochirus boettgeri]|uniref:Securin n=1 Tax=Hymenochirus boettgeri TaxID=247094 RepID=A0A8T2J0F8_9PIPI|nr:hypothetical protein GDO86_008447 [Hymenochirus boettgeri]
MATKIFVDQENGDVGNVLPKDRLRLLSNSKSTSMKGLPFPGKVFGVTNGLPKASRKALGNINKQVLPQKSVTTQKSGLKQKKPPLVSKKASSQPVKVNDQYPEIEHIIPYNPSDFESFDVPEDHKLSHLCLVGVPLMVNGREVSRFDALTEIQISPIDMPPVHLESG